jgi:predicted nucleic acid-binding protein
LTLYLDTSVLVAALTNEVGTGRVQAWMTGQHAEDFAISEWVITEFSSAMSIKMRTAQIEASHRADALTAFTNLTTDSFVVLAVTSEQFRTAARFASQHSLGLRAADALHLAVCADHGATLCTLDRRLGAAAQDLGVKTAPV